MNRSLTHQLITVICIFFIFSSCTRRGDEIWDDTKSATRHIGQGFRTLGGKQGDSRQVTGREEFMYYENDYCSDFVPLQDDIEQIAMVDARIRPPKTSPGDPGGNIPGIDAFRDPATISSLSHIFQNINFQYNNSNITGNKNQEIIRQIALFLNRRPNIYLFVEGHCDDRGPQAYNLALGSRRSNTVRNSLIQQGVSPDRIFTISYGKEKPIVPERNEEAWALNRRAEFKIFER